MKQEAEEKLSEIPNPKWQKLIDQFKEIETIEVEQWKVVHTLGYFVKKYQETFGKPYSFKFNTPLPSKSFEVWQIKSLSGKLSSKPKILKEYIDWFYEGIVKSKKRFTSISAMTKDEYVNDFKWNVLSPTLTGSKSSLHLDRSTQLIPAFQEVLADFGFSIKTYGDLAFMYHSTKSSNSDEARHFNEVLLHMKLEGFDISSLEKIV